MSQATVTGPRAGQSDNAQGTTHTLVVLVDDRPGAIDRVVGAFRRRRANMQTLVLGRSEQPEVVRVTVEVTDTEVGVDHLVEQLRKIVDVKQVINLSNTQAITRELALIKVASTATQINDIIELAHQFGAYTVDVTSESVTLEVVGNVEKVERFVTLLQPYGIREIAYSGRVSMARGDVDHTSKTK